MNTRGSVHSFQYSYGELCNVHNCPVLYRVNVHVHTGVLDFYGDGIKIHEWRPILRALSMDQSLRFIAIRSRNLPARPKTAPSGPTHLKKSLSEQTVIRDSSAIPRTLLRSLSESLRDCLWCNQNLTGLELDGLLLNMENLELLCSGVRTSVSLHYLSLRRCLIGDRGCQIVCNTLRTHGSVNSIDFSACNLTDIGALLLSQMLENLNRYNENWKQSLRYRVPNSDTMPGLRRITLNHNGINDSGAQHLIHVLHDDRWVKAVDMQNCGLTEMSGEKILKMVQVNDTLTVMDIRNNKAIPADIIADVNDLLSSRASQFEWLPDDPACLPRSYSQFAESRTGLRPCASGPVESRTNVRKAMSTVAFGRSASLKTSRAFISNMDSKQEFRNRLLGKQSRTSINCRSSQTSSKNRSGTTDTDVEGLQRQIEELSSELEIEVAKRKAAEAMRDKAQNRLEAHLRELAETQAAITGRVLVDKGVIQEVNSAFSDLNNFLAMLRKAGLCQFMNIVHNTSNSDSWNTSFSSGLKPYDDEPTSSQTSDISCGVETKEDSAGKLEEVETNISIQDKSSSKAEDLEMLKSSSSEMKLKDSLRKYKNPSGAQRNNTAASSSSSPGEYSVCQDTASAENESRKSRVNQPQGCHEASKKDSEGHSHNSAHDEQNYSEESDPSWTTMTSVSSERNEKAVACA